MLVESNISDRATYVLGSNELENLRSKSRSYLRDEKPKGFVDRVVHPGDRDDLRMNWVERISPYLTKAD